ncbi:MAG: hypothetical protein C4528_03685 [Gammaproteobacteria bacterium]|nr:MAG: hypothetical protein C4528_03685 [Gammaproteobacteria bacterium]
MGNPLRTLISQSSLSEQDLERLELEALRLRERYLSNPQCPKWYRDRAGNMTFWRQFHGSQPMVG